MSRIESICLKTAFVLMAVFFIVVACCSAVRAGGCKVVAQQKVIQQVVTPVVPVIQAVQVQVPLYTYSYPQQQAQAYQAETAPVDCCQQLVEELAKLRAEIAALRGAPVLTPGTAPGASLMQSRCAVCHTATKSPKGDLELFGPDGKRLPLSLTVKQRIKRRVLSNDMPKPEPGHPATPLTDAEKDAFFKELEQ